MGVESVSGSSTPDSSALGWIESTIAAAESYAREANHQAWETRTDGVDDPPKSAPERALDAFWANDPNRPAATVPGGDNSSSGSGSDVSSSSSSNGGSAGGGGTETSQSPEAGAHSGGTPSGGDSAGSGASNGPPVYIVNSGWDSVTQISIESVNITVPPNPPPALILPSLADHYNGSGGQPTPAASPQPQSSSNPPGGVQEPQDAGAPDAPKQPERIVSGAGAKIDEMINKSPSLRQLWENAKAQGWQIKFRDKGGSEADPEDKIVWIDKNDIKDVRNFEIHMSSLLSHEIGHAGTPYQQRINAATEEEFVHKNTAKDMAHEGAAAFHNARARDEIIANGGPDIGIRGGFDQEYIRIYAQYKSGQITEAEAIERMTYFMALEPQKVEGGRYLTKQEVQERKYHDEWADDHPTN
jgi:hypothetical protein